MKFSVLISVYFKEKPEYLKSAIESLLNQTCQPSQIVIVKDGKLTTELDKLIDDFVENNNAIFTMVELEKNSGLGVALNEGLQKCKYDLVARMDGDDICKNNRFEKQLALFRKNPRLEIVGSNIAEFDHDIHNIISERKMPQTDEEIKEFAKKRNPFNHMTVMYKKAAVQAAGGYLDFAGFEDYYLWVRMILNGAVCENSPENLVYARTGAAMYERRGGFSYAKTELKLQNEFYKLNFINRKQQLKNSFIRVITRIIPNAWRKWIYLKCLRG